ncbi:MAG: glucose-6-phosphate dehydrogenase assembly protein OpcA [Candidatus Obscuribacterales bacterium]|nr:glucose-6-phosphate dehydrogenase assembly protein OpcA [Candidatus Obscuribacterales bacterium]
MAQTDTMTNNTTSFLSGKLHHVDIDGIEKELYRLWTEAGKNEEHVTRACSLNFIVLTNGKMQIQAEEMLTEITIKHPCRAILAVAEPDETESLDAWVTARCHMIGGKADRQICCEQITVAWRGDGTRQLVSVVAPLTIPDLPICIWWQEESLDMDRVRPFLPHIDRFIVDTNHMKAPYSGIVGLETLLNILTGGAAIYDLNWQRLRPWRYALAHAFDDRAGLLEVEDLDSISSLEITVSQKDDKEPSLAQALLLLGWLSSRLSWQLVSANRDGAGIESVYRLSYTKIDARIETIREPSLTPGLVQKVRIGLKDNTEKELRIWQDDLHPGLSTGMVATGSQATPHGTRCREKPQAELIGALLDNPTRDKILVSAVYAACDLIRCFR